MHIGILQCDQLDADLLAEFGPYHDMFTKLLQQADPKLTYTVYDVHYGEFPKHIDAADAYLITGSRHGVNDGFPWISALEELVRSLHDARKKVIGICFGHQLIVKALGGRVAKSPKGWGIGMSVNKITQQKHWMLPSLADLNLLVSHQDQVIELPAETEVLAASEFCPFYVLQIRDNLLTVQGHPEFSTVYTQALIEIRKKMYGDDLSEQGLKSLQLKCDNEVFIRWIVNFLSV